jgi:nucleotide-binding universal stress UspA family protein
MRNIVVGYDGSEAASHALNRASELAKLYGCSMTVLTAAADRYFREDGVLTPALDEEAGRRVAELGAHQARLHGVQSVEARISTEAPDDALVLAAQEGCDLLAVGHRGLGALKELLLGSTARSVVERAPCRVLVVR